MTLFLFPIVVCSSKHFSTRKGQVVDFLFRIFINYLIFNRLFSQLHDYNLIVFSVNRLIGSVFGKEQGEKMFECTKYIDCQKSEFFLQTDYLTKNSSILDFRKSITFRLIKTSSIYVLLMKHLNLTVKFFLLQSFRVTSALFCTNMDKIKIACVFNDYV